MMVRKRLSDLLREEAQRSPDETPESDAAPQPTNNRKKPQPAKAATSPSTKEPVAEPMPPVASSDREAELEATVAGLKEAIADLESNLGIARRTEDALRLELTNLESALHDQEDQIHQLKGELELAQQSKIELEQTKHLILTLSEENLKLHKELESLKSRPAAAIQPTATSRPQSSYIELRRIFQHPVSRDLPSTALSDSDIGWVD